MRCVRCVLALSCAVTLRLIISVLFSKAFQQHFSAQRGCNWHDDVATEKLIDQSLSKHKPQKLLTRGGPTD